MVRPLVVLLAVFLALPASAHAADLSVDASGVLRYTGTPGKTSNVAVHRERHGPVTVEQFAVDARRTTSRSAPVAAARRQSVRVHGAT